MYYYDLQDLLFSLKDITRLVIVQRRAMRFIVPLSHCLDYKGRLTELQLLMYC